MRSKTDKSTRHDNISSYGRPERRQHTFCSITGESSRSRNPIVGSNDDLSTIESILMDPSPDIAHQQVKVVPTTAGLPIRRGESPFTPSLREKISLQNRRLDSSSLHGKEYKSNSDDLSLDNILADIQAGKLEDLLPVDNSNNNNNNNNKNSTASCSSSFDSSICEFENQSNHGKLRDTIVNRPDQRRSGFEIVWLNFRYSVEPNIFEDPKWGAINSLFHKEHKSILKGISGSVKSGQMVALMGPSGAGKTCLLECIAGLRVSGIGGHMYLSGKRSATIVIVPQYDDFLPQFTVEEIIHFGSKMKNPAQTDHKAVTKAVIKQLGLEVCRKNNIQRCSGGQRKRVAIAQELVSRPNILILDEPTSGLDSSRCYQTMKFLRDVLDQSITTDQPMAIVTTIHQPSAKVFKLFDSVYLLGKTGFTAYSGPPEELIPTIRKVTGLDCPKYSNPSDFMIELVSYDYGHEPVEKLIEHEKIKAKSYVEEFRRHSNLTEETSLRGSVVGSSQHLSPVDDTPGPDSENGSHLSLKSFSDRLKPRNIWTTSRAVDQSKSDTLVPLRKATSSQNSKHPFLRHFVIHTHRAFLQSMRDKMLNGMRVLIHLGFASLLVILYGQKSGEARGCPVVIGLPTEITDPDHDDMVDLADNVGYLFMCIMLITYVSLMSMVLTFPIDIKTIGKEYKNGWYDTLTYFLGKTIADLPFIVIYPIIYSSIVFYVTNQASGQLWRFLSFTGLIIMNAMNSQSFGLILGAVFVNSMTAATFLGPIITIPWYLFTGFTKRIHRLPDPLQKAAKILFTRYTFEGLVETVYGQNRCNCSEFLEKYHEMRNEEAIRLGQMISAETLSSLDYYDGIEYIVNQNETTPAINALTTGSIIGRTFDAASNFFAEGEALDMASLIDTNNKATSLFSFGLDFEPECPQNYQNYVTQAFKLKEGAIERGFGLTLLFLFITRLITFFIVMYRIKTRQL